MRTDDKVTFSKFDAKASLSMVSLPRAFGIV
ncbi:mCG1050950 [Mus musculus]|nr:mCG1050950 [Mus musculus]